MDFIVENPDVVKRAIEVKGVQLDLDRLLALHSEVKALLVQVEELRRDRNALSKETGQAKPEERAGLIERSRAVGEQLKDREPLLREKQEELARLLLLVPNIPGPDEPVGHDEESNVELRRWGEPPAFSFALRDHVDLLEQHGWAEFQRAGKLAGSRMYALRSEGALLEFALWHMAIDHLRTQGFTLVGVPALAREAAFVGTGHFPAGREDVYQLEDDLFLSGTAEVGLNYLHSDEILTAGDLPTRYAGYSPCFRREAGAAGRDVRGLLRVHQFFKIEQYVMCRADRDESARWFDALLANAEHLVQALELPYHVIRLCTGEMGVGKVRAWDLECWLPSQKRYLETHTVSELHDWQARRANLRYRDDEGKVRHAYTLNNTAIATPRIIAPLLEVHQQQDGSIRVPAALRPYLGGWESLPPA